MADYNLTTGATFRRTLWSKDLMIARQALLVMFPRVSNRTGEFKKGYTVRVPLISNLAAVDLAEDGSYDPQAVTETYSDITIDTRKAVPIRITGELQELSYIDLAKEYTPKMAYGLAKVLDSALLGLHALFSSAGSQVDIDMDFVRSAVVTLDNSNVPPENRHIVLYPTQYWKVFGEASATHSNVLGIGKSPLITTELPSLLGLEWLKSTQVPTSSTKKNLIWHESAMAAALAKKVEMQQKDVSGKIATDYIGWELYGVKAERTDHALILDTTNTA